MNRIYYYTLCSLVLFASACRNPLDKEFKRETAEEDFTRIVKLGKLDSADASIMAHFMIENELIGAQVLEIGATYRDILKEAKAYWEKKQAFEGRINDHHSKQDKIIQISVKRVSSRIEQSPWSSSHKYLLTISNQSDKTVKAFKGHFVFIDPFGEPLHEVEYKYLNPLAPRQKVELPVTFRLLRSISTERIIQYSGSDPFRVEWRADSVIAN